MKYLQKLLLITCSATFVACSNELPNWNEYELFNNNWTFVRTDSTFNATDSAKLIAGLTPQNANCISLPHTARLEPLVVNDQWQGICYYLKHFTIDNEDLSKNLFLKFEGAMNVADVWINGQHATQHIGGYLPFIVKLNNLIHQGDNIIVVRLDNQDNKITGPKPLHLLDFNTYGGLYRDVKLISENAIYISDANCGRTNAGIKTNSNIVGNKAFVTIDADIVNSLDEAKNIRIELRIINQNSKIIASDICDTLIMPNNNMQCQKTLSIDNPQLWSPDEPNLYSLKTIVSYNNQISDIHEEKIGIRTIEIKPEGLWLNGEKTFLRGVNRHQEYPYIGYAMSNEAQWRDAYNIKEAGFDYVRASHYPPSPAFLDACDHYGIMVLDAILGWQYFGDSLFQAHAVSSSAELIRRDRNHPCVLAWELSINETWMPKSFYPQIDSVRNTEQPQSLTAGWVKGPYDIYIEARQHRKNVDPSKPLIVSEYGDWEYYAQNAGFNQEGWNDLLQEERTSRQPRESGEQRLLQQALNIQEAHNDNLSTHALADGYWVMYDYNRGYADDIEYSGIADIFRLPKFSYFFFQSQRPATGKSQFNKPMVAIASHCTDSSTNKIRVFSNCDSVQFFVDGKKFKNRATTDAISSNLKFKPLTFSIDTSMHQSIEAKGFINGKHVCSDIVRRPLEPTSLTLSTNEGPIKAHAGSNDVIFIYANIVDTNNTTIPNASNEVKFSIAGDAKFATPSEYTKTFTTNALGGIATATLIIGDNANEITISATSLNSTQTLKIVCN